MKAIKTRVFLISSILTCFINNSILSTIHLLGWASKDFSTPNDGLYTPNICSFLSYTKWMYNAPYESFLQNTPNDSLFHNIPNNSLLIIVSNVNAYLTAPYLPLSWKWLLMLYIIFPAYLTLQKPMEGFDHQTGEWYGAW